MSENTKTSSPQLETVMEKYDIVIGIEVHCQLATQSKMFSPARNAYGDAPNTNIDATCLGLPGSLPVINEAGVDLGIRMALALGGEIHPVSTFSRKNYFYPDLPKGYQITQYDRPFCTGGDLELSTGKKIRIERIQIEEDAAKNIHVGEASLVDYNRAGVGLIEIVSAPDLSSPIEAGEYLRKLHSYAVHLGISDGDMEKGNFRADANVSLKPRGSQVYGKRCEIKNLNSFKYLEKAVTSEVIRQYHILDAGGEVISETRGYDSERNLTFSQRSKEAAPDYRYFPEPDLPPLIITAQRIERVRAAMPELPEDRAQRFVNEFGIPTYDAQVISSWKVGADYFEALAVGLSQRVSPKAIANYFMTDILRACKIFAEKSGLAMDELVQISIPLAHSMTLLTLQTEGVISGRIAKDIFEDMIETGEDPAVIVKERNLIQISDESEILQVCSAVLDAHPEPLADYLKGREKLFGFFVGQAMKQSGGKLNPARVNEILKTLLEDRRSS